MGSFKRIRDTAIVVLLLSVPFFFLRASIRNPQDMNPVVSALSRVGAPLEYMASAVARFVSSGVSQYVYLVDVKQDNNRLAYENARLTARVRELEQAQADNRRLRRLLGDYQPAPVPVHLVHSGGRLLPRKLRAFLEFAGPRLKAALEADQAQIREIKASTGRRSPRSPGR